MSMMIKELLAVARSRLTDAGCLDPALDADILLCHTIDRDKTYLVLHYAEQQDDRICEEYFQLVDTRAEGTPVQYITGKQEFMGLPFQVNPHVLIPRQDTETLVECALMELAGRKSPLGGFRILDLCCGSGAIAVSIACHTKSKKLKIFASDVSEDALKTAKANAVQNHAAGTIQFIQGDLFEPFPKNRKGKGKRQFDLIASNPPYIPASVLPTLMREVREHEPMIALDGGPSGLDFYERILAEAHNHLRDEGVLLLEIGCDQAAAVAAIAEAAGGYGPAEVIKDLAGRDRVVKLRLRGLAR